MMDWQAWVGREQRRSDTVTDGLLTRWCATLDRPVPAAIPQGLHWCLCLPDAQTAGLGEDGHPLRDESADSFLPPVPLPRRMWASSKVDFCEVLPQGAHVERISRVISVKEKSGGSGRLVFVEIEHETLADQVICVREVQSLVYREPAPAGVPPAPPPPGSSTFDRSTWNVVRSVTPSEALLFRFSALTFNSHRIHYDLPYATGEEGYRGLVVHGPLTATLLLDLARRQLGENSLRHFAFRGTSPAICGEELNLALRSEGDALVLGAFASDGRQVMDAIARI
ncbi:hypothetical protein [Novosphingobium olei]|uniref:hypothetical protein n=1 Tax=Novosphingobium olei TaxID=2728851 RepID=UPI0030D06528